MAPLIQNKNGVNNPHVSTKHGIAELSSVPYKEQVYKEGRGFRPRSKPRRSYEIDWIVGGRVDQFCFFPLW